MAFPVDQTVSRSGVDYTAPTDSRALFLKLFAGEVLTQFRASNMALGLTRVRTISNGKSAQFPMIGTNSAKYHTPGTLIEANKIEHSEMTVTIDDIAISPVFIAELDEAMSHYEVRAQYASECSYALASLIDRNIFRMIARVGKADNAAKVRAIGGQVLSDDKFVGPEAVADPTKGEDLVNALFKARTKFRKADVTGELVAVFPPEQYEALVNAAGNVGNMAWMNRDVGGAGSAADGSIFKVAGIRILESNHLPQANETAKINDPEPLDDKAIGSGRAAAYREDYSDVVGVVFTRDCVATVKLKDISLVHKTEELRLGHTIYAKMAVGHNILRHQCACTLVTGAGTAVTTPNT